MREESYSDALPEVLRMNKKIRKRIIELTIVLVALSFMAGCGSKAPTDTTHLERGSVSVIRGEIFNNCLENNDTQGAKDVLDTYLYLMAFCCQPYTEITYDDMLNRRYENVDLDIGDLQLSVAAYNKYNDESAMDIEVDWICHYNTCTQDQLGAIDAYVEWYHTAQNGHYEGTIKEYRDLFSSSYDKLRQEYDGDISNAPRYDDLTPEQFREVQNYMEDPDYQVDTSVWE